MFSQLVLALHALFSLYALGVEQGCNDYFKTVIITITNYFSGFCNDYNYDYKLITFLNIVIDYSSNYFSVYIISVK